MSPVQLWESAREGDVSSSIDFAWPTAIANRLAHKGSAVDRTAGLIHKKSTHIQFFPTSDRHYQTKSRRMSAGGFSFVQVAHEYVAMG